MHILYDLGIALVSIDGIFHSSDGKEVHSKFNMKSLLIPGSESISIIESKLLLIWV